MKPSGILLLSVLLLLALLPGVDLPAAADEADICAYLLTSYDVDNYMEFSIAADTVTVSGKLQLDDLEGLMVRCGENREFIETASGRPFTVVSSDMSAPVTRPLLPRTSSGMSGFFFWGMREEPVQ